MAAVRTILLVAAMAACGLAAACTAPGQDRPAAKPDMLRVHVTDKQGQVTQGRVSTKSGELLILEPDGSISQMTVDSNGARDAFAVTDADLAGLGVNLSLDLSELPGAMALVPSAARGMSAQERALAAFGARSQPLLPRAPEGLPPETFHAAKVEMLGDDVSDDGSRMVSVTANLAPGVDADTAFAYATCALADWADTNDAGYARHVRSLSRRGHDRVRIESVFTLSKGPRPMGLQVMEPKGTLQACARLGIPRA